MSYVLVTSACLCCKRLFSYNPHRVPSFPVDGTREPICRDCIEHINRVRKTRGMDAFVIRPDAYEPLPEHEL